MSDPVKKIEEAKEELAKVKIANSNIDIESIFDIVKNTSTANLPVAKNRRPDHQSINTIDVIRQKLAVTKEVDGAAVPVYSEDEKVKIIFALLAEKGLNLLDSLEKVLEKDGYKYASGSEGAFESGSEKLVDNINDAFTNATSVLRDIAEIQYKKSKLELEKENLRIQDYKAKLKEKELEIKERAINRSVGNSGNTNIIAVASQAELLALMKAQRDQPAIEEKEAEVVDEKE